MAKNFSLFIIIIAFLYFIYLFIGALDIVNKTKFRTKNGVYTSYITISEEITERSLNLTKNCKSSLCKIQTLLNFVTDIPYKTETFQKLSASKTIKQNFGDCNDKSNLLISMLYSLNIKAYLVLVPKHIFIIVSINDLRIEEKKGLWVNSKKYYILESTAKNSMVGFPLHYKLTEIDTIIEPFSNSQIHIKKLEWKR